MSTTNSNIKSFDAYEIFNMNDMNSHICAYMINNNKNSIIFSSKLQVLEINTDLLDSLCKKRVNLKVLNNIVQKLNENEYLFILTAYDGQTQKELLGIRVAIINFKEKYVKGKFLCAAGVGRVLQQYTEHIIVNNLQYIFQQYTGEVVRESTDKFMSIRDPIVNIKNITMSFTALDEAANFWKSLGFKYTEEESLKQKKGKHKDGTMAKPLENSPQNSVLNTLQDVFRKITVQDTTKKGTTNQGTAIKRSPKTDKKRAPNSNSSGESAVTSKRTKVPKMSKNI